MFDDHDWYPDKHDPYWDELAADIEHADYCQAMREIDERDGPPDDYDGDEIPLQPKQPKAAAKRFHLERVSSDKPLSDMEWAVDGYIPEGMVCIVGKPSSFKTFGTIDAACCMATGLPCCGQRTGPPQKVIYIASDAGRSIRLRIRAWILAHLDVLKKAGVVLEVDVKGRHYLPNLKIYPTALNLSNPTELFEVLQDIRDEKISADVICIDTLFSVSVGSSLAKPEEALPILGHLDKLMKALGAKTCLIVHHTTKNGKGYFGTIALEAAAACMILFEKSNETTAKVSCDKMQDGDKFKPFEIRLQKVTVKIKPDRFGRTEREPLAVIPETGAAATQQPVKEDKDLDFMERVLVLHLGNAATNRQWFDEMVKVMPPKKDKATGELKPGVSETTLLRWLKKIAELGHVTLPADDELTSQGYIYSIVAGPWAIQPGTVASGMGGSTVTNHLHSIPEGGMEVDGGGFGDHQAPPKHRQTESGGGSSQGRAEGKDSPPVPSGEDLIVEATAHVRANPTVQAAADRAQARSDATKTKMK
jgi:hypothetical protein